MPEIRVDMFARKRERRKEGETCSDPVSKVAKSRTRSREPSKLEY